MRDAATDGKTKIGATIKKSREPPEKNATARYRRREPAAV
jgi:hypothetical protein